MTFKLPHPEALPGEIWLTNTDAVQTIGKFATARYGKVAYGIDDNVVPGRPMFVMESELRALGWTILPQEDRFDPIRGWCCAPPATSPAGPDRKKFKGGS